MVRRITRFRCDKCRKRYASYGEALDCEYSHLTAEAIRDSGSGPSGRKAEGFECEAPQSGGEAASPTLPLEAA